MKRVPLRAVAALALLLAVPATAAVGYVAITEYGYRYLPVAPSAKPDNCGPGRVCGYADTTSAPRWWDGTLDRAIVAVSPSPAAKGEIAAWNGSTSYVGVAAGSNGQCLQADSTQASGLKYGSCGGGGGGTFYQTIDSCPINPPLTGICSNTAKPQEPILFFGTNIGCTDNAGSTRTECNLNTDIVITNSVSALQFGYDQSNLHSPPPGSGTLLSTDATQTETNKTLTSPLLNGIPVVSPSPIAFTGDGAVTTSWTACPLVNSWVDYDSTHVCAYSKDAAGNFHMRGAIKSGSCGTTAFTIPAKNRCHAGMDYFKDAGAVSGGNVSISIHCDTGVATVNCSSVTLVPLDGINYPAEQ